MQDSTGTGHIRTAITLFFFNVASVGLIAIALFVLNLQILGMLLSFATVSLVLIASMMYFKYNGKHLNSFSGIPVIVERVISKSNQPLTICRHAVTDSGLVRPKVVYANTAYLDLNNLKSQDIIGKDTMYPQEVSEIDRIKILQAFQDGVPVSAKIVDRDIDGRLFENELNISPVEVNGKIAYWVGYRSFIQYLDSNVIKLGNQLARIDQSHID